MAKRRARVYIAGPISKGDLAHNINQATRAFVALTKAGFAPFCPHWSAFAGQAIRGHVRVADGWLNDGEGVVFAVAQAQPNELTHRDWLEADLPWVAASDIVLRLPGDSLGADIEEGYARELGVPVCYDLQKLIENYKSSV